MKPDGTNPLSTAGWKQTAPRDIRITEPNGKNGSEIEKCLQPGCTTWSYLFVHNSKVKGIEEQLAKDGRIYFIHKTVRYFKKTGTKKVQHQEVPTVSGLIFFQGLPTEIQSYLGEKFPPLYLCKNCSTGRVAVIPDAQMRPFMRVNGTDPERIRFLLKPFHYYARNRTLLRITSGELAGLEGYVIRIDRDRRLVMDAGGISVAISGVHAEHFEEVRREKMTQDEESPFYKRNLQEREALVDRYFQPVKTAGDAVLQAENIDFLREHVLAEQAQRRMKTNDVWNTLAFIIKEIGYYYSPLIDHYEEQLAPIMKAGGKVFQEMGSILEDAQTDEEIKKRYQAEHQELLMKYSYMF